MSTPASAFGAAVDLTARAKALSQRVAAAQKRVVAESETTAGEVTSLLDAIKQARKDNKEEKDEVVEDQLLQAEKLIRGGPGGDLRKYLKVRTPLLISLVLGSSAQVVTFRNDQCNKLKDEYYRFRDRITIVKFLFPAVLLLGVRRAEMLASEPGQNSVPSFTPTLVTGIQVLLAWLVYSYVATAMREAVLLINGSNIRPWWIQHHYWSAVVCFILLSLPVNSPALQAVVGQFLKWTCFQAVVMFFQNRYQRKRMYTRTALGKSNAMDVVGGEISGISGQVYILYPLLWILQAWQLKLGLEMTLHNLHSMLDTAGWLEMENPESDLRGSRGVLVVGIMVALMSVLNFVNTTTTFLEKRKMARRIKMRVSSSRKQL